MTTDLVVFGEDWNSHPSSTQHLVRRMLPGWKVLWVNSIGLRRPRLTGYDLGRATRKLWDAVRPARADAGENPIVMSPVAVPAPRSSAVHLVNGMLLRTSIRRAMLRAGMERPILWTSLPTAVSSLGTLGERASIYYCGDDFGALAGVDHQAVAQAERELARRVDLILAASPSLAAKFPADKTRLISHGVDFEAFSRQTPRPDDLPADRPIAGFFGALSEWIDLDLIARAARVLADWQFVLIGPVRRDLSVLTALPNVAVLGPRPHAKLAAYAQHWTVSLIPFHDTPQIRACNPLKLREYLAAGTPVVSTSFPAARAYRDVVSIAHGHDAFIAAIAAGRKDPVENVLRRRAAVARESWDVRAAEVDQLLRQL